MSNDLQVIRAMRRPLTCLPDSVDRNSAREVLEFVTRSSYPTAADPLLAVAHAAAQLILAMHDELHAQLVLVRAVTQVEDDAQRVIVEAPLHHNRELYEFAQHVQQLLATARGGAE